eukprot:Skav232354  [mRNA]  locus=scaffold2646:467730:477246:+ [translate_table: standard]
MREEDEDEDVELPPVAATPLRDDPPPPSNFSKLLPCGEILGPMDFGALGDGLQDDSGPVLAAISHGIRCNTTVLLGPARQRFLVMPNVLDVPGSSPRSVTARVDGGVAAHAWGHPWLLGTLSRTWE